MVFFLLVNTMIGSGILNQPEVFAKTGMIGALLMLLGVAYITWYGVHLIVAMTTRIKQPGYQQAVLHTLGPTGENIYLVSVIIMAMFFIFFVMIVVIMIIFFFNMIILIIFFVSMVMFFKNISFSKFKFF